MNSQTAGQPDAADGGSGLAAQSPPRWGQALAFAASGIVCGLDGISFAIAVASLLFTGSLSAGLGVAITAALAGSILVNLALGWRSAIVANIAVVQDVGVAILVTTLAATAGALASPPEARIATAFAIIALSSLATAAALYSTGQFNLGRIARYFPLEVLAGFMAATGWFLLTGASAMMTGTPATFAAWAALVQPENMMRFLPALALGLAIYACQVRFRHPMTLVGLLLGATLLFHAWRAYAGVSLEEAGQMSLLLSPGGSAALTLPFPSMLGDVQWTAVLAAAPAVMMVAVLSLFGALMNVTALELLDGKDIDGGREMKITGAANALVAATGGPPTYSDLAGSQMTKRLGVKVRGVGFAMAAVEIAGLIWAASIISYIPVFVAAGLIAYYGIDLLKEWLIATYRKFSPREWLVVAVIVATSSVYSFIVAILLGFCIATVLFAFSYANTPVVRNETALDRLPSTNDRPAADAALIAGAGHCVRVLQLQGFLFFGTSEQVIARVRAAATEAQGGQLKLVIIDFSKVTNIDSASANVLKRIEAMAAGLGFAVVFTGLDPLLLASLRRAGLGTAPSAVLRIGDHLDTALEAAEEQILHEIRGGGGARTQRQHLVDMGLPELALDRLLRKMSRMEFAPGEHLIRAGDAADMIYFIESGRAIVVRPGANGNRGRLRTMLAGAIVGEVAFSLAGKRTADVIAELPTVAHGLSTRQVSILEQEDPQLALAFHRLIGRALAEKVVAANRMTEHVGR
jgi:sulfate permease, SulP family